MYYFVISLISGTCMLAILLLVFFKAGKKNKKQRAADLLLVQNSGDVGLLRLYEQVDSDNERDGIVEFIKEKLAREEKSATESSVNFDSAGEVAFATDPDAEAVKPPQPEQSAPRRVIQGISSTFVDESAEKTLMRAGSNEHIAYPPPGDTHMLALETVDWHAIENELQRKREEEARIVAQNQQIQEVFSKIREVEERLTAQPRDSEND